MSFKKIKIETVIARDQMTVWEAWTKPEHITKWNFASNDWCCPSAEIDLRVGGQYRARMEAKDKSFGFDFEATYSEVKPFAKISLLMSDGRKASTDFEAVDGRTKVTTVFDAETQNSEQVQREGWQAILDSFKRYVENAGELALQAIPRSRVCLMLDKGAEQAANFYAEIFPNSSIGAIHRAPSDYPSGRAGDVLSIEFTVLGIPCLGVNGGSYFKHSEAFSFQVATDTQEETDRYWDAIVKNGGQESMCGWCKDKWGVSWQITPRTLTAAMSKGGDEAKRVFDAMMKMKKIDVAAIEAARKGKK